MTLLVALYGGPGTGKSTTAALVFGQLKQDGYNVELVGEVAKDFTWEDRHYALSHQAYIAAKQMRNWDRLNGKVDAVITDTSTLLSLIYGGPANTPAELAFYDWLVKDWKERNTLDIVLRRDPSAPYNTAGRRQAEEEAVALDKEIAHLLIDTLGRAPAQIMVDRQHSSHIAGIVSAVASTIDLLKVGTPE